jgi:transcriptional antiterminator RfaH
MEEQGNLFPGGNNWYVVQTKPKSEKRAASYLTERGIETLLPWMETLQVGAGRTAKGLQPLFPNYLFARFNLLEDYALVRWGRGINKVLGCGSYPAPIADEAIAIVKSRIDERGVAKRAYDLQKDDHIKIISGPLRDLLGVFDRWASDSGRVKVLLNLVGYQPRVELHYSQVEKAC